MVLESGAGKRRCMRNAHLPGWAFMHRRPTGVGREEGLQDAR